MVVIANQKIIKFTRLRTITTILSIIMIVGSIVFLITKGINFGLDFTGGTIIELVYDKPANIANIREQLAEASYGEASYGNVVIQEFGSVQNIVVRIQSEDSDLINSIPQLLDQKHDGQFFVKRVEFIGPQVGENLREQGSLSMLIALGMIMFYITFRFQFKFSIGVVLALTHDFLIVLGLFSLLQLQFDLIVLTAILAVVGYSLNNTIVVYDRIRENFCKLRTSAIEDVINLSLTQILGRTLATSGTTLMVLLSLFLFGGKMMHGFSTALILGICVGTYSSIYITSNLLMCMKVNRNDLIVYKR